MPSRVLALSRSSINIYWMAQWKNHLVLQLNCHTTHPLLPKGSLDGQLLLWSPRMSPDCILISQHHCCGNLHEGTWDFAPSSALELVLMLTLSGTCLSQFMDSSWAPSVCPSSFLPSLPATDRGTRGSPRAKTQLPAAFPTLKLV